MKNNKNLVDSLEKNSNKIFEKSMSFAEYLEDVEKNPEIHLRTAAMYLKDVFDHYGRSKGRFNLFTADSLKLKNVYGNKKVQNNIYQQLLKFIEIGSNNKLMMLVGPNGSGKTSIVNKLIEATEAYSLEEKGALYSFTWLFSNTSYNGNRNMGVIQDTESQESDSFAKLSSDKITSMLQSDLREHPILLIPKLARQEYLKKILSTSPENKALLSKIKKTYLYKSDLSKNFSDIFNSILKHHNGKYEEVYKHIRIDRFEISKRYSKSIAIIEPQMHSDIQSNQITADRTISYLPTYVQAKNLHSKSGELVYGNRGLLEYSDFFKRNPETFKYLLSTIENGEVNVKGLVTELDILFFATSNEIKLENFMNSLEAKSFLDRFKMISIPYLLNEKDEKHIYNDLFREIDLHKFEKDALDIFSAWSVMSRFLGLKEDLYSRDITATIRKINPLHKLLIHSDKVHELIHYGFDEEEIKVIKSNCKNIIEENINERIYEGRFGVSPRQAKELLLNMSRDRENITTFDIINFLSKISEQEIYIDEKLVEQLNSGRTKFFCNNQKIIELLNLYLKEKIRKDVLESLNLIDKSNYEKEIQEYISDLSFYKRKEKKKNPYTMKYDFVNPLALKEVEKFLNISKPITEFRQSILSKFASYATDQKDGIESLKYTELFKEEIYKDLKKRFNTRQEQEMKNLKKSIKYIDNEDFSNLPEDLEKVIDKMEVSKGYSREYAIQSIIFLIN